MLSGKEFNYYIHDKAKKEGKIHVTLTLGKICGKKLCQDCLREKEEGG